MPIPSYILLRITNNQTTHCEINSNKIGDEDIAELVELLNKHPAVSHMELGQTNVTDAGIVLLNQLKFVRSLSLPRNDIGDAGVISLVKNPQFKRLDLHGNPAITDIAGQCMAEMATQLSINVADTSITFLVAELIKQKTSHNIAADKFNNAATIKPGFFAEEKTAPNRQSDLNEDELKTLHRGGALKIIKFGS